MSVTPVDPRIGSELAGYRIEALLGRGGMSVVYRAEDRALRRKVALKVLAPELASDERFRERFLRESHTAASIDHANVIPIYEAGEAQGLLYIAMRYVEGTDLGSMLEREGRLEPRRALSILGQAAAALDAARFARGLVHRDVKPGNILLAAEHGADSPDHVYLSDFGLSTHTAEEGRLTEGGHFMGTIDYVAPEQIEGEPVDGRTDVYSLGCVLYECLTGQVPYAKGSKMALLWAHLQAPPPTVTGLCPDLPAGIDAVVGRALAKSPDERYPTCRELIAAARAELRPVSEEHATVARASPDPPPARRFRLPLTLAALLAVAATAAVPSILLTGGGGSSLAGAPGLLVRIDPRANEVKAEIGVGSNPGAVAVGKRAVWVGNGTDGTVSKIDPQTNRVVQTFGAAGFPMSIAAVDEPEGAWIANGFDVVAIHPDGESPSRLELGRRAVDGFHDVAAGAGSVWASGNDDRTVLQIDAASASVLGTIEKPGAGGWSGVAYGAGSLWLASDADDTVLRVDPVTRRITATIEAGVGQYPFAVFAGGSLWVAGHFPGTVLRIDPATNRVVRRIEVAEGGSGPLPWPFPFAVGDGALWIAYHYDGAVVRVDPISAKVAATIRVGGFPSGIAFGHGSVWVAVAGSGEP